MFERLNSLMYGWLGYFGLGEIGGISKALLFFRLERPFCSLPPLPCTRVPAQKKEAARKRPPHKVFKKGQSQMLFIVSQIDGSSSGLRRWCPAGRIRRKEGH